MKSNPVTVAREKAGLGRVEAARLAGLSPQVLTNIERAQGFTRETEPSKCQLGTILRLVELYYPHLELDDLVPDTPFRLTPKDRNTGISLRRNVGKPLS